MFQIMHLIKVAQTLVHIQNTFIPRQNLKLPMNPQIREESRQDKVYINFNN